MRTCVYFMVLEIAVLSVFLPLEDAMVVETREDSGVGLGYSQCFVGDENDMELRLFGRALGLLRQMRVGV